MCPGNKWEQIWEKSDLGNLEKGQNLVKRADTCPHGGLGHLCLQLTAGEVGKPTGWCGVQGRGTQSIGNHMMRDREHVSGCLCETGTARESRSTQKSTNMSSGLCRGLVSSVRAFPDREQLATPASSLEAPQGRAAVPGVPIR